MKKIILSALVVGMLTACSQMTETEKTIESFLKTNANDPSTVELLSNELVKSQTIGEIYEDYIKTFANNEEKEDLINNKSALASDMTEVSYCFKVKFRAKNGMNAIVLSEMFLLFDKDMKPLASGDDLLGLNGVQMKKILFQ